MTSFEAVLLGIIQGITEFLPISSTAHLRVIPALVGWQDPGAAFTAVTQLGTLFATLVYFRDDLWKLFKGTLQSYQRGQLMGTQEAKLTLGIVLGTVPIGICGLMFQTAIKTHLRSLHVVAITLIGLAALLFVSERLARHRRSLEEMTFTDALLVGVAQAFALIPGASRSGVTITAGLLLGLRRETAARFSFLLSIPAIGAAGLFEMKDVIKSDELGGGILFPTIIATVVATVFGWLAIAFLINYLKRRSTMVFVGYRIALGVLLLGLLGAGVILP